jgi:hypothetical protein
MFVVGTPTRMPAGVRIIATSVGEKSRLEDAFADMNFASTRLGSASDRPRSILMKRAGAWDVEWR